MKLKIKPIISFFIIISVIFYSVPSLFFFNSAAYSETLVYGEIIEFGLYPQSEVTDEELLAELNGIELDWISYEYYFDCSCTDFCDCMRYADVELNGEKYRVVTLNNLRVGFNNIDWSSYEGYDLIPPGNCWVGSDHVGYEQGLKFWFKFEPLKWRVIDPDKGIVLCETIIDSQPYNESYRVYDGNNENCYGDSSYSSYANDYSHSIIRSWLNNSFFNTAFNDTEKELMHFNMINDISDKVFLLSYGDFLNSDYGFNPDENADDMNRSCVASDYARCQGVYSNVNDEYELTDNYSVYWVRTSATNSEIAYTVGYDGIFSYDLVYYPGCGVRPALKLRAEAISDGTFCGKLESEVMTVVLNGSDIYVSSVVIDGLKYDVKDNLITESLTDYFNRDVVYTIENGEIVWFSTVWDLVQRINCNLVVTDEITYSGKEYSTDEIQARIDVKYSYKDKNVAELKAISELGVAVSGVKLKSSNPNLLNFDGEEETTVLFNDIVPIGGSASKYVTINVDSSYVISDLTEKEVVSVTCDISAAGDGRLIQKVPGGKFITIANINYEKPVVDEAVEPDETDIIDTSKLAQNAGEILFNGFQGAAAGLGTDSYIYNILTIEQLQAIGNILICEASMASAEKDSFSEGTISDALFEEVFNFKKFLCFNNKEISVTVVVAPPNIDGDLKIKFTCIAESWELIDTSYTIHGNVHYEIIGGKGSKHIPKDKKEGFIGALYVANAKSFCEASWALAEAELKNAYDIAWGDDVNSAVDLIFGKCVNKILKAANLDTVSGFTWKLLTIPAASVIIECPVDVYVYNSNDELLAAVEDNEVILTDDKAQIMVNGDTKYVTLFDESYYIVYEATADGTMRVTVNEQANSEDIIRTVVIDEIPLESGAIFSQNIDGNILEESDYSITADDETIYTADSDETTFHYHETDGEWFEGKAVECTEDGWNYTLCNMCGEWYKEVISCIGHIDKDENGYCDVCDKISNVELVKDIYISIATPETRTISYMESIKLYANAVNLPEGYKIKWKVEGDGVSIKPSANGKTCTVTSTSTGNVVIKAYIVDSNGNIVTDENGKQICDSEYFYSEANLWLKIVYFFKKLFGISMTTAQLFKVAI